jgi:hypothetical protein
MSSDTDMQARHQATLEEFQAQGRKLAGLLFVRAEQEAQAGNEAEARGFAMAWHRITRSVRQSMALEALFKRQRERDARDDADRAELAEAVAAGKVKPHHRVGGRLVWHEAEREDEPVSYGDFLEGVHARERARLDAVAADPAAYLVWLEKREAAARDDLARAREALAAGRPLPPGPLVELPEDGLLPRYDVTAGDTS